MKALPRSTAKDVFSHLLAIATLYVAILSFLALYFQYINVHFPDPLSFYYLSSLNIIRQAMAALIVVWPVFIGMSWLTRRDMASEPEKREIGIRKWLLYLTLFITAITIMADLVTLVNYFLNGEITTRFVLKVLVILVTGLVVFWYYLWDLRHDAKAKAGVPKTTAIISSIVIALTIILGFVFVGSPTKQRQVRFDDQRTNDLSTIQSEVMSYYATAHLLPTSLDKLNAQISGFTVPVDPVTGTAYTYTVKDTTSFELCATFETASIGQGDIKNAPRSYPVGAYYDQTWDHSAGQTCFTRQVDPALYPPSKTP